MKTLTTLEKTMNMQKLGTVSAFLPHFNNLIKSIINNALYVIVYTLCELSAPVKTALRGCQSSPQGQPIK